MEVSKIIVAGACDVAAGTPLAILGEIGRAAHQGAIIKGGLYLEALAAVDTVLLDKTGTLTFGTPEIREVVWANGFGEQEIIAAASIAERKSEANVGIAMGSGTDVARESAEAALGSHRGLGSC